MTKEETEKAINELRASGYTDQHIAETFKLMYLDNQIDIREFESLINLLGYELSDEYKNIDKATFRSRNLVELINIEYDQGTKKTNDYSTFIYNKNVYFSLLQNAKKTKSGVKDFIEYIRELDCNLKLESMKHLKLSLMPGTKYTSKYIKNLLESSRYKENNTFYHLYLAYWECDKTVHSKACKMIEKNLKELFYINYEHPENKLFMEMERLLTSIEMYDQKNIQKSELTKLVNTLKVKFLIMHRDYYPNGKVNIYLGSPKALLKQCEDKMDKKILNEILKYYNSKYYEIVDASPNGYKTLFFTLIDKGDN